MKKTIILLLVFAFAASAVFAQQGLTLSGEAKTGIRWMKEESSQGDDENNKLTLDFHSNDDAGDYLGRFRLNLDYINEDGTKGFKIRMQWEKWARSDDELNIPETWPYAFVFGNFFDNQLTMSIGKLGGSPWGTGGPEMWKELENTRRTGGIRFEYKPVFIPEEYGKLNIGFVLNGPDSYTDAGMERDPEILDLLKETVFGISYTHEYFMIRGEYRLDSELDIRNRGTEGKEGDDIVYRVEERAIQQVLPDFQIWALGFIQGVGAEKQDFIEYKNWLFIQYAPKLFTAQLRTGYEGGEGRSVAYVKPNFYWKFFEGLIEVGSLFGIAQDYGDAKIYKGSPYSYWEVMPKIQINFAPGAYAAFEYYLKREYKYKIDPALKQTQWMNLRFGLYF
jgi:hypothetical protein